MPGESYRSTGRPLHCVGPSSPKVPMIAVPPTLSVRRKCAMYVSRWSVVVRKWNTARSCQMSTGETCQSPVKSASIHAARAARAPSRVRARVNAAGETSKTVTHVSPRSRRRSTRRESPPPTSMIQVFGPRPTWSSRCSDGSGLA